MKDQSGFFAKIANRLKKLFAQQPSPPPFEDPSRTVFDGLVGFLPIVENDARRSGDIEGADRLAGYMRYFQNLHGQGCVALLSPNERARLSKFLRECSHDYKSVSGPRDMREVRAGRIRISEYLASEVENGNLQGNIREKELSEVLTLLDRKRHSKTPQPTETFEDPSRRVNEGFREFLPLVERDMRGLGEAAIADGLAELKERFDLGHRERFVPFFTSDEKKRFSKLLTQASLKYKSAQVEDKDRTPVDQCSRIAQYLATAISEGDVYGEIRDKDLSDFLDVIASISPPVPTQPTDSRQTITYAEVLLQLLPLVAKELPEAAHLCAKLPKTPQLIIEIGESYLRPQYNVRGTPDEEFYRNRHVSFRTIAKHYEQDTQNTPVKEQWIIDTLRAVPPHKPVSEKPKHEPEAKKTSGLPQPFKASPPSTESTTRQTQDAIKKAFQLEPTPQPKPSPIPPLDFSDSTRLCTVKEYLIQLLPAIQEDLTNGSFRSDHGDIRQTLAAAVPAFIDALSSGGEMDGLLLQRVTLLEGVAEIYAEEIRKHPQYPHVFLSSAIEKYKTVKYIRQRVQSGNLDTSVTQGDINFFNSTLELP